MNVEAALLILLTLTLEVVAHLSCRLHFGREGFRSLHPWVREVLGTTILLAGPTAWVLLYYPRGIVVMVLTWICAVGTGAALGVSHLLQECRYLRRRLAEELEVSEVRRGARGDSA